MFRPVRFALAAALIAAPAALPAQRMSESYEFLKAVRDADGNKVTKMLDTPGSTIVNTRDKDSGETALHIAVKRGDATYTNFLSARGANVNAQDTRGNTPLLIAVGGGYADCVDLLITRRANVNQANSAGETPLIRAVQLRNLDLTQRLLTAGANPDQPDRVAGMTARDYAKVDNRSTAIVKLLNDAPKASTRGVSGPKL